jgi:hypothetical protein
MLDITLWATGLVVWGIVVGAIIIGIVYLLYRTIMASLDIASQYFLLYMEKRESKCKMSWLVWWSSFDTTNWGIIFYRIKRAFGKANRG